MVLCSRLLSSFLLLVWAYAASYPTVEAFAPRRLTHPTQSVARARAQHPVKAKPIRTEPPTLSPLVRVFLNRSTTSDSTFANRPLTRRTLGGALVVLTVVISTTTPLTSRWWTRVLQTYKHAMTVRPMYTKMMTGSVLATVGDALAQSRAATEHYDARRAASFAAFDAVYRMFQHFSFPFIIANCQGRLLAWLLSGLPGLSRLGGQVMPFLATCERTLAYQLLVVPLLYYPIFFIFTGFMQGLTFKATVDRAKTNFLPCWKRNLMFWIPVQMFMFGLVNEKWQIPFVCVMGIAWSSILSVTAGKATTRSGSQAK